MGRIVVMIERPLWVPWMQSVHSHTQPGESQAFCSEKERSQAPCEKPEHPLLGWPKVLASDSDKEASV